MPYWWYRNSDIYLYIFWFLAGLTYEELCSFEPPIFEDDDDDDME